MSAAPLLFQGSGPGASAKDDGGGRNALTFHVVFSPFNYTDLGQPGPSAADVIVFHDQLLQGGKLVGDEVGSCVVVDPGGGLANCTRRHPAEQTGDDCLLLRRCPPSRKVLAVTGGSGQLRSAGGDGTLDEFGDGTGTLVLRLDT